MKIMINRRYLLWFLAYVSAPLIVYSSPFVLTEIRRGIGMWMGPNQTFLRRRSISSKVVIVFFLGKVRNYFSNLFRLSRTRWILVVKISSKPCRDHSIKAWARTSFQLRSDSLLILQLLQPKATLSPHPNKAATTWRKKSYGKRFLSVGRQIRSEVFAAPSSCWPHTGHTRRPD